MKIVNLAYYREEDWKKFLSIIDDREKMHDTWQEWIKDFRKAKRNLENQGFVVIEVTVDLDKLIAFCEQKGLKNNGSSRSQFVTNL